MSRVSLVPKERHTGQMSLDGLKRERIFDNDNPSFGFWKGKFHEPILDTVFNFLRIHRRFVDGGPRNTSIL